MCLNTKIIERNNLFLNYYISTKLKFEDFEATNENKIVVQEPILHTTSTYFSFL